MRYPYKDPYKKAPRNRTVIRISPNRIYKKDLYINKEDQEGALPSPYKTYKMMRRISPNRINRRT